MLLESAYFTRTGRPADRPAARPAQRGVAPVRARLRSRGARARRDPVRGLIVEWAGGTVARGVAGDGEPPTRRWVSMRPARASMLLDDDVTAERRARGVRPTRDGVSGRRRRARGRGARLPRRHRARGRPDRGGRPRPAATTASGARFPPPGRPVASRRRTRSGTGCATSWCGPVCARSSLLSFASGDDLAFASDLDAIRDHQPAPGRRRVPSDTAHTRAAARRRAEPGARERGGRDLRDRHRLPDRGPRGGTGLGRVRARRSRGARLGGGAPGVRRARRQGRPRDGDGRGSACFRGRSVRRSIGAVPPGTVRDDPRRRFDRRHRRRDPSRGPRRPSTSRAASRSGSSSVDALLGGDGQGVRGPRRPPVPAGPSRPRLHRARADPRRRGPARAGGGGRRAPGSSASCSTSSAADRCPRARRASRSRSTSARPTGRSPARRPTPRRRADRRPPARATSVPSSAPAEPRRGPVRRPGG